MTMRASRIRDNSSTSNGNGSLELEISPFIGHPGPIHTRTLRPGVSLQCTASEYTERSALLQLSVLPVKAAITDRRGRSHIARGQELRSTSTANSLPSVVGRAD